jgi:recombination associated protein RdgC
MWFKNLTLFRFLEPFTLSAEVLAERLGRFPFRACASLEPVTYGWVPALGPKASDFVHASNGCLLFCLQAEQRVLPAAVVREAIASRTEILEDKENRALRRHERLALRDEILQDLLPRAFTCRRQSFAYIDPRDGWLVIDSVARKAVEEVTQRLRETLGRLAIGPLKLSKTPAGVMTSWLQQGDLPAGFTLGDECELRDGNEQGGVVRCKGQDLTGTEIQAHVSAGKQVTRLALSCDERIDFVLSEDMSVRRLRFRELGKPELEASQAQNPEALHDAEFTLISGELSLLLPRLVELLGGEREHDAL